MAALNVIGMATFNDNQQFRKLLQAYPAKAIEMLYDYYAHILKSQALYLTQDDVAAEDIVQETFVAIWENHKQLGQLHEKSIEHYLARIVRNKAVDYFRQKMMLNVVPTIKRNGESIEIPEKSFEVSYIEKEVIQNIRALLEDFPKREKECLLMRMDDEKSVQEIADLLKVTTKAVERSLTSARKRLRRYWV